jgi:hypothetical protein
MEEADFECSLNTRLLTRHINLPDDWEARWCDSSGRYEFHNVVTNVTESDFPTLSATTLGSPIWGISGGPHETGTPAILDLLTRIFPNTHEHRNPENAKIESCIEGLRVVYGYGNVDYGLISMMFADLVAAIEDDRQMISRQHRDLVDFLYARLKDARSTIEKLKPADSLVGELCHADVALPTNASEHPMSNVSRSTKPGNISSSSPLTITQQSMDLEPSQRHRLTSIPRSPIHRPSRAESDPIQAHEPEGDAPNNTQGNPDSAKELSSARKRKSQSTKDPTKFKHECDTCGERFTRSTTLREHSRTHTNERPFPCSKCSKTFARKKDKIRHEKLHLGEKTFYCRLEGCGRCFTREDGLVAHLRTERGWKCLQGFMASTYCQTYIEIHLRHANGFRCELTQRSCHGEFNDLSDLKYHLQDIANRECATGWLTRTFLRLNRFAQISQDTKSDASEAERPDSWRHLTSQDRQEPSTSAPRDPRSTNGALLELSDAVEAVEFPSPARRITKTARQNETMEIDQATTVSRLRDGIQSTEASASDSDPFAGWHLSSTQSSQCYRISRSWGVEIHINCMQKLPKAFYRVTVGDQEIISSVFWSRSISGGFHVTLVIDCGLLIHSPSSLAVSVVHRSDQLPNKKLPLGTLNYDIITKEWFFLPRPQQVFPKSPQPTPASAEAIGDEVTSVEKSASAVPGNDHQLEQSSSFGEVVNIQRQPVNKNISQSASITNYNSVSDWKIVFSFFNTKADRGLWVGLKHRGRNVPSLRTGVLSFGFTQPDIGGNRITTMVQAMCPLSPIEGSGVYHIQPHLSIDEWFRTHPVAVHLHIGSADVKLFVGTLRYNLEGRLVWHQASPRETCPCSSCV